MYFPGLEQSTIDYLATPKKIHPLFVPDRCSVYWKDYLIDERPLKMKDVGQLNQYYENQIKNFPRTALLSRARVHDEVPPSREKTSFGIPISALNYAPSRRIVELATPIPREPEKEPLKLPPISSKYTKGFDTYSIQSRGDGFAVGASSASRSRSRAPSDYGKGDYNRGYSPFQNNVLKRRDMAASFRRPSGPEIARKYRGRSRERIRLPPIENSETHRGQGEGLRQQTQSTKQWR